MIRAADVPPAPQAQIRHAEANAAWAALLAEGMLRALRERGALDDAACTRMIDWMAAEIADLPWPEASHWLRDDLDARLRRRRLEFG